MTITPSSSRASSSQLVLAPKNPHDAFPSESSSLHLSYHNSISCIAANQVAVMATSSFNSNSFELALYKRVDDVTASYETFIEDTKKRCDSKPTSYTNEPLRRDINGIRVIASQLDDHLKDCRSKQPDHFYEIFATILAKSHELLESIPTDLQEPQSPTVQPSQTPYLPSRALETIQETTGADDWANAELSSNNARLKGDLELSQDEGSTTLAASNGLTASSVKGVSSQKPFLPKGIESDTTSLHADSIQAGETTLATKHTPSFLQRYTRHLRRDKPVSEPDLEPGNAQSADGERPHLQRGTGNDRPPSLRRPTTHHISPSRRSAVSHRSMEKLYHSSLAIFSILVPSLAVALGALTFVSLLIETTNFGSKYAPLLTKLQFAKDMIRNWGPAGLLIVSIFHEHTNALDWSKLRWFSGLLTIFMLLIVVSIGLEATGYTPYADMTADISDISLLLTTFFYFEWVLKRNE